MTVPTDLDSMANWTILACCVWEDANNSCKIPCILSGLHLVVGIS